MILVWYKHSFKGAPLVEVLGLSLAKRAVLSAQAAGFKDIVIVVHPQDMALTKKELADSKIKAKVKLLTEAQSLSKTIEMSGIDSSNEVAVVLGDRVWTAPAIKALTKPLEGASVRLVCDNSSDRFCTGLFRVETTQINKLPLSGNCTEALLNKTFNDADTNPDTIDIATLAFSAARIEENTNLRAAENILLRALKKSADGVVSRNINRKISLFLSRRLAKTAMRPNHITAVVAGIGLFSGFSNYFIGGYWGFLIGGLCYYISAILDGCDGEISRLKYLGSSLGAWLDTIVDDLVCLSFIVGLYARLYVDEPSDFRLWTGLAGVFFFLLTILPRYYIMATRLGSGDFQKLAAAQKPAEPVGFSKLVQTVKETLFRTDFLPFYGFVTALVSYVPAFAIPFAIGAIASSGDTLVTLVTTRPKK